jgi:hypothetical protein
LGILIVSNQNLLDYKVVNCAEEKKNSLPFIRKRRKRKIENKRAKVLRRNSKYKPFIQYAIDLFWYSKGKYLI